jgi:hypothetical protein
MKTSCMHRAHLELEPGLVLDARRAIWLAAERTLVVADLARGLCLGAAPKRATAPTVGE